MKTKTTKTDVKALKIKPATTAAKNTVATKTESTVLAPSSLPTTKFQTNIRTAENPVPFEPATTVPAAAKPAEKKKRVSLNLQPVLDAKTAALKAKGVKLTWVGRSWHAGDKTFTSLEMSKYTVDEFAALFPAK